MCVSPQSRLAAASAIRSRANSSCRFTGIKIGLRTTHARATRSQRSWRPSMCACSWRSTASSSAGERDEMSPSETMIPGRRPGIAYAYRRLSDSVTTPPGWRPRSLFWAANIRTTFTTTTDANKGAITPAELPRTMCTPSRCSQEWRRAPMTGRATIACSEKCDSNARVAMARGRSTATAARRAATGVIRANNGAITTDRTDAHSNGRARSINAYHPLRAFGGVFHGRGATTSLRNRREAHAD